MQRLEVSGAVGPIRRQTVNTFIKERTELERLQSRENEEHKSIRDAIINFSVVMSL